MSAEDDFVIKDNLGILIDNSEETLEADPVRKRATINYVKEDFINRHLLTGSTHNVEMLPGRIAVKYNMPLPIAKEVANHVIADRRSVIDHEPVLDTVFIYRKKE
jgi:hypothetical protein